jgi:DNA modification methylase
VSWLFQYPEWLIFGFPYIGRDAPFSGLLVWDKRGDGGEAGLGNPVEVAIGNGFNGYRLIRHVWAGYVRETGEKRLPHPTQKPVGTMVDAIKLVRNENILDPFLGSGTTLIAAEQEKRRCFALEISPQYVDVAVRRWQDYTGREAILDGSGRTFAEVEAERKSSLTVLTK